MFVRGKIKIDVQMKDGAVTTMVVEAGTSGPVEIRNPWPGKVLHVTSGKGAMVAKDLARPPIEFEAIAGTNYLVQPSDTLRNFAAITGIPAATAKRLSPAQIGILAEPCVRGL